jgi:hypothetical protein
LQFICNYISKYPREEDRENTNMGATRNFLPREEPENLFTNLTLCHLKHFQGLLAICGLLPYTLMLKNSVLWDTMPCSLLKVKNISPPSSGSRNKPSKKL